MPTTRQLIVLCILVSIVSVVVVLVMHAIGLGRHAIIAAAVSSASAATVASLGMQRSQSEG